MKRLIIGATTAVLMGGGMVAVSAPATNAAECPYTGCVETRTTVNVVGDPIKRGNAAKICVKVTSGGNGKPKGRVGIGVTRTNGGYRFLDSKRYDGGKTCFQTSKLTKGGKYVVRANYEAGAKTVFKDSDYSTSFRVNKTGK